MLESMRRGTAKHSPPLMHFVWCNQSIRKSAIHSGMNLIEEKLDVSVKSIAP